MRLLVLAAASLLGAGLAPPARASLSGLMFKAPAYVLDTSPLPYGITPVIGDQVHGIASDLDGDGRSDIALLGTLSTSAPGDSVVSILYSRPPHLLPEFSPDPTVVWLPVDSARCATEMKMADANEDGWKDLVFLIASGDSILFLENPGAARFPPGPQPSSSYVRSYTGGATGFALGDVNEDGHIDVVATIGGTSARALFGNGGGAFSLGPTSPGTGTLLADVDGDGHLDLVGADAVNDVVRYYRGLGDGTFVPGASTAVAQTPVAIAVGDVDGDGIADIVAACQGDNFVSLLRGIGGGAFASATNYAVGQLGIRDIALADLNGDGHPEIINACMPSDGWSNYGDPVGTLTVLVNNGFGGFGAPVLYQAGGSLGDVMIGDFDGDGTTDVAASDFRSPSFQFSPPGYAGLDLHAVSVLLNDGSGHLGAADLLPLPDSARPLIGDFDRDGNPDLMVLPLNSGQLLFYKGNGDGTFADPILAYDFGASSVANTPLGMGDVDRDGKLDLVIVDPSVAGSFVLLGNGNGTFTAGPALPGPIQTGPKFPVLRDLNRDGVLDLVLLGLDDFQVFLGQGGGSFGAPNAYIFSPYSQPPDPTGYVFDDWNRDGKIDLALSMETTGSTAGGVRVYWGNGDGSFSVGPTLAGTMSFGAITSGDWNRDGKPDLAARHMSPSEYSQQLYGPVVFSGNGSGGFGPGVEWPGFEWRGNFMGSWDINRDGYPDLIADSWNVSGADLGGFSELTVYLGNGTGSLARDSDFLAGSYVYAAGDIDRDGQPDVLALVGAYGASPYYFSILRGNQPPFPGPPTNLVTSTTPGVQTYSISVGDVNRDGIADAVVTGAGVAGDELSLLIGQGDGTFTTGSLFAMPDEPFRTAMGDLNGDGIPDVAVATGVSDAVLVLLGNSSGLLSTPTTIVSGLGYEYADVALADLNRDGKLDIVAASAGSGAILVLLGNGDGTFGSPMFTSTGSDNPTRIAIGDVNRDGIPDVVAALGVGLSPSNVGVLLGHGDGTLDTIRPYAAGVNPYAVALGDFNRDGIPDAAVTLTGGTGSRYVAILPGTVGGGFGSATTYPLSANAYDIAAADIDGDGILDLVASDSYPGNQVSYLRGLGNGSFAARTDITVGTGPTNLAIGDFNRDGRPDIATALQGGPTIAVLRSSPSAVTGVAAPGTPPAPIAELSQNAPNPFNPQTRIRFSLSRPGRAALRVFDVRGREVATLVDAMLPAGPHEVTWDGAHAARGPAASGVYFYRLEAPGFTETRRMVLLK